LTRASKWGPRWAAAPMGSGTSKQKGKVYSAETIKVSPKGPEAPEVKIAPLFCLRPSALDRRPSELDCKPTLLAADVGGTSSRLHLFYPSEGDAKTIGQQNNIFSQKYYNDKFESLSDVICRFMEDSGADQMPYAACLAVAGVVVDNKAHLVNLGWHVDGFRMAAELGIGRIDLINDFEAQGYGVLTLDPRVDCDIIQDAPIQENAPAAVMGAGTGLGEAYLTTGENGDYEVWPSEGGHAEWAPRQEGSTALQFELLQYLQIKYSAKSRISVERIVSGKGIANIYQFLAWKFPEKVNSEVHRKFCGPVEGMQFDGGLKNDPAPIVEAARNGTCEISLQTVNFFIGAYGSEAGVLALKYMPFGGLFITGGVSSKTRDFILGQRGKEHHFIDSFLDKGRVSRILTNVPIFLVRGEDLGERGVKLKALRIFLEQDFVRSHSRGHMTDKD